MSRLDLEPEPPRAERIYGRLPRALQSLALSVEGWRQRRERYGGDFGARLAAYRARERASDDEIDAVRRAKLRRLLAHAATHVPHWRKTFREAGLDPERVRGPEDLSVLPLLTKDDVRRLGRELVSTATEGAEVRKVHTSGTTGAGLVFLTTVEAIRDQWAVWWRYRMAHGLTLTTWQATFAGRSIGSSEGDDPRPWRTNRAGRQVLFSQYHFNAHTLPAVLAELGRSGIAWYHGYPSFVAQLAAAAGGTTRLRPRWVTLGAENVQAAQARTIRDAFGVAPLEHYGLAEMVANASQCPEGRIHLDEDFAAVELVPAADGLVRIVGTSLSNLVMPFVRYDTGDLARVAPGRCGCGRPGRILESIDGRREDLLVLSDGTAVGRLDHLFKDAVRIAEAQIRQTAPGVCTVAVVPRDGFSATDEAALLDEFRARFGDRLAVRLEIVPSIPRTSRGKLRLVVHEPKA
ncbi:MAG TPA: hypothetical protein VJ826_12350 [Candidatus Polarisedimenticolaceae bacterium]|nr:hypothetical protein [Candidatus Polarisedimenticolaceae bacterium]